jgi:hypothetical protein
MRNFPNHRSIQRQSVLLLALLARGDENNTIRIAAEVRILYWLSATHPLPLLYCFPW